MCVLVGMKDGIIDSEPDNCTPVGGKGGGTAMVESCSGTLGLLKSFSS